MKRNEGSWRHAKVCAVAVAMLVMFACAIHGQHSLRIEMVPQFAENALIFDAMTNTTTAGQRLSIARLDFLLSHFALRRATGEWIENTNWFAFISGRNGRTSDELNDVPDGVYDCVRFTIGLPTELNHADPAQFSPTHPLNPNVNGMHWNWQGGYVFFAMEGHWLPLSHLSGVRGKSVGTSRSDPSREANGPLPPTAGFSYHLATDAHLMTVTLPIEFAFTNSLVIRVAFNVEKVFEGKHSLEISDLTSSSHSRPDDDLAIRLRENVERSFTVQSVHRISPTVAKDRSRAIEVSPNATPYRFTMSSLFPQPRLPADNPLTVEGVELGKSLFNEPLLSINGSQSCASCHNARRAFTEDKRFSPGAEGAVGTRNAMPLLNLAWKDSYFWDGRTETLREQVLQPIQNPIEMHESLSNVVGKLNGPTYRKMFARAFGSTNITADRMARALEQFLLTQVSYESKFDRVLRGDAQFTEDEQRGFDLFHTEYDPRRGQFGADCFHCHGGPLFQNVNFANNGLDTFFKDQGRFEATKREGDKGKFSVPSLRNVEVTAPYMHDGRFATLEQTIEHYSTGVKRSATLDPNLAKHPDSGVPLTSEGKRALLAFLKTLTDEQFKRSPTRSVAQR